MTRTVALLATLLLIGCGSGGDSKAERSAGAGTAGSDLPRKAIPTDHLPGSWKLFEERKVRWTFRYPPSYKLLKHDEPDAAVADGERAFCSPGNKSPRGEDLSDATRDAARIYTEEGESVSGLRTESTTNGFLGRLELASTKTREDRPRPSVTLAVFDSNGFWDTLGCVAATPDVFARKRREFDRIIRSLRY